MPEAIDFSRYAEIALAAYPTFSVLGEIPTHSLVGSDRGRGGIGE